MAKGKCRYCGGVTPKENYTICGCCANKQKQVKRLKEVCNAIAASPDAERIGKIKFIRGN